MPESQSSADRQLLAECDDLDAELTPWEVNFIGDLMSRNRFPLTDRQRACLVKILNKYEDA